MRPAPGPPPVRTGGRAYHELLRGPGHRWWKPAVGLVVVSGTFFLAALVLVRVGTALMGVSGTVSIDQLSDEHGPLFLAWLNLSVAVMIPATVLAMLLVHRQRFGWLSSVAGRLRWRYLARTAWLAVVVAVGFMFATALLPVNGDGVESPPTVAFGTWLGLAVVVLITTPLQATAEEYAFRGYAMQALSAWLRAPWIPIVVTSLAFAFAHGSQDGWLFLDRFAFGLIACWLVIRTGGLEAAIAMHVVNNVLIFLMAAAFDQVDDELTVSAMPWHLAVLHILQMVAFAWLAIRSFNKHGLSPLTAPSSFDHVKQAG